MEAACNEPACMEAVCNEPARIEPVACGDTGLYMLHIR